MGKKLLHGFLRGVLIVLIPIVIFCFLTSVFIKKSSNEGLPNLVDFTPYNRSMIMDGFYDLERDTLDVVFVGSSHIYSNVNPTILFDKYGFTSYDFACGSQVLNVSRYYVEEVFRTQKPKLVVIDLLNAYDTVIASPESHTSFDFMRSVSVKTEGILDVVPSSEWIDALFPLTAFHERWKELEKSDFTYLFADKHNYFGGYLGITYASPQDPATFVVSDEVSDVPESTKQILDEIINICSENGAQCLFIKTPFSCPESMQAYYNGIEAYLDSEHGLKMVNVNRHLDEIGFDFLIDYADTVHMSYTGADKFSLWLGQYLVENYELPDHRNSEDYVQWAEDWNYYRQRVEVYEYEKNSYLSAMLLSDPSMRQENGTICIQNSQIMFGPYISLSPGNYSIEIEADTSENALLSITSNSGKDGIAEFKLLNGTHLYEFSLEDQTQEIEFVIVNREEVPIYISDLRLKRVL